MIKNITVKPNIFVNMHNKDNVELFIKPVKRVPHIFFPPTHTSPLPYYILWACTVLTAVLLRLM